MACGSFCEINLQSLPFFIPMLWSCLTQWYISCKIRIQIEGKGGGAPIWVFKNRISNNQAPCLESLFQFLKNQKRRNGDKMKKIVVFASVILVLALVPCVALAYYSSDITTVSFAELPNGNLISGEKIGDINFSSPSQLLIKDGRLGFAGNGQGLLYMTPMGNGFDTFSMEMWTSSGTSLSSLLFLGTGGNLIGSLSVSSSQKKSKILFGSEAPISAVVFADFGTSYINSVTFSKEVTPTPLPPSCIFLISGGLLLVFYRRTRRTSFS